MIGRRGYIIMQELEPITFSITDQDDLKKIRAFQEKHMEKCRKRFWDFTGAMFEYSALPTGLGTMYSVRCPCGKEI